MPQISLTDFVDIISKSGRPKATKVRQVKERPEYEPAFDFYKTIRDCIAETHRTGSDKQSLSNVLSGLTDPKKVKSYPDLVAGYKKWWGKKSLEWFPPPRDCYAISGFEIIVNPELGLSVNGNRHVVKLYFKSEPLSAFRIEIITDLMEHQLRNKVQATDTFSVLDVRNAKLFSATTGITGAMPIVNAEIAYIASIWGA